MEIIGIIISIIALGLSVTSFQWNKAKHNLNQLQDNAKKFCDNLQEFIGLGTEHYLTLYKYEIENIYHISDKERQNIAYNNLQVEFSKRKDYCSKAYRLLMESFEFLEIKGFFYNNEIVKLLNKTLNDYYMKLNQFYNDLYDINFIVRGAKLGVLTKDRIDKIHAFFDNVRELLDCNAVFSILKRDMAGYFSKLSLVDVGLFGETKKALIKIQKDISKIFTEFGFEDAINKDYTKIRRHVPNYGEGFDEFIEEERGDFLTFLNHVKDIGNK